MIAAAMTVDAAPETRIQLSLHAILEADETTPPFSSDDDSMDWAGGQNSFQHYPSQSVYKSERSEHQTSDSADIGSQVTTIMLCNIPKKYTPNALLQEIDEQGFVGSYNFFYLPVDGHKRSNVGYAFVNFRGSEDAQRFCTKFSGHHFQRFQSHKVSSVRAANVQGLDGNLHHFWHQSAARSGNSKCRPTVLKGNALIDVEDAVGAVKPKSDMSEVKEITPQSAPAPASMPPSRRSLEGHAAVGKHHAAPARTGYEALELAFRDLAAAKQLGHMQREAAAKSACLHRVAPPPGLAGYSVDPAGLPAYVSLPSLLRPGLGEYGSEARTTACFGFSRAVRRSNAGRQ